MAQRKANLFRVESVDLYIDISTPKFQGAECVVDMIDKDTVLDGNGRWFAASVGRYHVYVARHRGDKSEYLHRLVAGGPDGLDVDHADGDSFNNRRLNLRPATKRQNQQNSRSRAESVSQFKGVGFRRDTDRWFAAIKVGGKKKSLGCFDSETEAALAYDAAARSAFGSFARFNFPEGHAQ